MRALYRELNAWHRRAAKPLSQNLGSYADAVDALGAAREDLRVAVAQPSRSIARDLVLFYQVDRIDVAFSRVVLAAAGYRGLLDLRHGLGLVRPFRLAGPFRLRSRAAAGDIVHAVFLAFLWDRLRRLLAIDRIGRFRSRLRAAGGCVVADGVCVSLRGQFRPRRLPADQMIRFVRPGNFVRSRSNVVDDIDVAFAIRRAARAVAVGRDDGEAREVGGQRRIVCARAVFSASLRSRIFGPRPRVGGVDAVQVALRDDLVAGGGRRHLRAVQIFISLQRALDASSRPKRYRADGSVEVCRAAVLRRGLRLGGPIRTRGPVGPASSRLGRRGRGRRGHREAGEIIQQRAVVAGRRSLWPRSPVGRIDAVQIRGRRARRSLWPRPRVRGGGAVEEAPLHLLNLVALTVPEQLPPQGVRRVDGSAAVRGATPVGGEDVAVLAQRAVLARVHVSQRFRDVNRGLVEGHVIV
mmetsp:Transcript_5854/g.12866  ORF Transcript_5854/g.12866 Transcript_5854/m.12866 type:complete len:466 (-) Transcript_5854:778-2175(-)